MSSSRRVVKKKKGEEEPPPPPPPPQKSAEELLQEQLAATLLDVQAVRPPQSLHSPADVLWTMSVDEILTFCFPPGIQHPLSRARLVVLANMGPLVQRHSYTACLCSDCQEAVRSRRKTDAYAKRVFSGELFTRANVPSKKKKEVVEAASPAAATANITVNVNASPTAAATRHRKTNSSVSFSPSLFLHSDLPTPKPTAPPANVPALTRVASIQRAQMVDAGTAHSHGASVLTSPISNAATSNRSTSRDSTLNSPLTINVASASNSSRTITSLPAASPTAAGVTNSAAAASSSKGVPATLHNSHPTSFDLHPEYHNHTVDQLDYLCAKCQKHARCLAHCFGGIGGKLVLNTLQLNELARRIDEEDLLRAYNRWQVLSPEEERDFLCKLDGQKLARAHVQYTVDQMKTVLAEIPRISHEVTGEKTDRIDFYALQRAVQADRALRVSRLAEMYPDVASKGDKSLQASAVVLKHAKQRGNGLDNKAKNGEEKESVNGVSWQGESILTTAMLGRQYPPHQTYAVRTRLLHKHTHDVVQLGPDVNHPSVQLSVALMRNTRLSDKTEGWKPHF